MAGTSDLRNPVRRYLSLFAALILALAVSPALSLFTAPAAYAATTVTPTPVNTNCNGIIPTPGSENTTKKLVGGTLQPGGTAQFEITYPLDAGAVGDTFTIQDCPVIGGDVHGAQAYEFTYVPNNAIFDVIFTLNIPSGTPVGTTYCNYAKTTASPSAPQASNRKAGPACFTVGGNLRIEKHATGSSALLAGAQFSVSCPTAAPATPPTEPPVVVTGLVDSNAAAVTAAYNTTHHAWEAAGTADPGYIGIAGPSGTVCTVTETAPPPGYVLPSTTSHDYTLPVGTSQQVVNWYNDPAVPSLHLVKSAVPATGSTVDRGSTIAYTLAYYNNGNAAATNATITDTLPAHTTYVASSASNGGTYDAATRTITWTGINVPSGTSAASPAGTVTFSVTVDANTPQDTELDNTGHIALGTGTPVASNTTQHFVRFPVIGALKSSSPASGTQANPASVVPGQQIDYTISVSNTGSAAASNVSVSDVIPTGTTYVSGSADHGGVYTSGTSTLSWTVNVAANSSVDLHFSVTVDAGDVNGTTIDNTATVNGTSTNTTYHAVRFAVIGASKSSSPASGTVAAPAPVGLNQTIAYTVSVSNTGLAAASNVAVTDVIPTGTTYVAGSADNGGSYDSTTRTVSWTVNVGATGSLDLHFSVTVDSGDANGTLIDNTAVVNGQNTNTTHHEVEFPVIGALKSSSPISGTAASPAAVLPGQTITYTVAVTNTGLAAAHNVAVTDPIPAGTTYVAGSADHGGTFNTGTLSWSVDVAAGGTVNLTFKVTVDANDVNGTLIDNTATVAGSATNTTHHEVKFAVVSAAKASSPASGTSAQPAAVAPGQTISYVISVTNSGFADAHAVPASDPIPSGTTYVAGSADHGGTFSNGTLSWIVDVPAGATVDLHFQVTVNGNDPNGTLVDNTGFVNGAGTNTTHHVVKFPIVAATKSSDPASGTAASPASVSPGQTLTYTVTVSNTGLADATAVPVTDAVPVGTSYVAGSADHGGTFANGTVSWSVNVAAGSSVALHFAVTVDGADANGTMIDNTASVNGTSTNTTHHVVQFAVLGLAKSASPASGSIVQRGDTISYTLTLSNSGLAAAQSKTVQDTLPDHTTFVDGSATPAPTSRTGNVVTWTVNVPAQSSVAITYAVTVDNDAPQGATLTNVALVDGSCVGNPDTAACTTDHHVPTGALTLVKHVDKDSAEYGDTLTYTFDAATTGALDQTAVTVTDVLPDGTTYVNDSAVCTDQGACTATYDDATRTVTWVLGDVAAGAVRHLAFQVTIDTPDFDPTVGLPAATITNVGAVRSAETDKTPSNEVTTTIVAVLGEKVVRKPPTKPELPFTGLPAQGAAVLALLMINIGVAMTLVRRRRRA